MINHRFHADAFRAAGKDSADARSLADELETAVETELRHVLESAMAAVVDRLNAMGHNLEIQPGTSFPDIEYYDWDGSDYHSMRLRLSVQWTVAAGYAHMDLSSLDDLDH